jgi:hypothetical protein
MKAQSTTEKLLRTEDEHWNGYALRFLVQVRQSGLFQRKEDQALELYQAVVSTVVEHHSRPLNAEQAVEKLLEKLTLEEQRLVVLRGAYRYLAGSEWGTEEEPINLGPVLALLSLRTQLPELPGWEATARTRIRDLVWKELGNLPNFLDQLDAKDRVATLCKLIPYVLPKDEEQPPPTVKTW